MSRLAELRQLAPRRRLTRTEAFRVAELQANRLLRDASVDGPPVPASVIRELPFVAVDRWPNAPVSGSSHWTGKTWVIVVNADEPRVRRRFSIAHELFHVVDHPRRQMYLADESSSADSEDVANHFAACLLMPKRWIRHAVVIESVRTVPELASLFEVSRPAMRRRLSVLGLRDAVSDEGVAA